MGTQIFDRYLTAAAQKYGQLKFETKHYGYDQRLAEMKGVVEDFDYKNEVDLYKDLRDHKTAPDDGKYQQICDRAETWTNFIELELRRIQELQARHSSTLLAVGDLASLQDMLDKKAHDINEELNKMKKEYGYKKQYYKNKIKMHMLLHLTDEHILTEEDKNFPEYGKLSDLLKQDSVHNKEASDIMKKIEGMVQNKILYIGIKLTCYKKYVEILTEHGLDISEAKRELDAASDELRVLNGQKQADEPAEPAEPFIMWFYNIMKIGKIISAEKEKNKGRFNEKVAKEIDTFLNELLLWAR